jgi:hypothetical protein
MSNDDKWEEGYRDAHVGRESNPPSKSPFAYAKERYDYKHGYEEGEKDRKAGK